MGHTSRLSRIVLLAAVTAALASGCEGAPAWDTDASSKSSSSSDDDGTPLPLPLPDPVTDTPPETPRIALANFLAARNIAEVPPHRDALVDLDNDGRTDLLMLLEGRNWCDRGGCAMLVFHRDADGLRLVTRTRATHAPIRVSRQTHNGWRDLLVGVGGAGTRAGTVVLQFNGSGYPANPPLLAMLAESALPPARVVIE